MSVGEMLRYHAEFMRTLVRFGAPAWKRREALHEFMLLLQWHDMLSEQE